MPRARIRKLLALNTITAVIAAAAVAVAIAMSGPAAVWHRTIDPDYGDGIAITAVAGPVAAAGPDCISYCADSRTR